MSKVIVRFDPLDDRPVEECERHYVDAHIPMAQSHLREVTGLVSYHVNRALWQLDVAGGFRQRPRAWRFVILKLIPGQAFGFTPAVNEMVAQDHTNCLCRMRSCAVEEEIMLDRLTGNFSLAKFLLELDRNPDLTAGEADQAVSRVTAAVADAVGNAYGFRLLVANRVLSELETESISAPGQRAVGVLAASTKLSYLECYFDHPRWGFEALGRLGGPNSPLRDPALGVANLMFVEEHTALDTR